MKKLIVGLLIISAFVFNSCNSKTKKEDHEFVKVESGNCFLDEAENKIISLKEVELKAKFIDSLSNHKSGISLISDSLDIDGISYYEIKAGYNTKIRFENYYTFYIEKGNCENIKIFEPIEGVVISLLKWRKIQNDTKNPNLILENGQLKKIALPFSFYEYFKSEYSEEKYHSYTATKNLIDFLISKDYEGENYKCFIIPSKKDYLNIVVSISRGDSEYYVLVTSKESKILNFIEIGCIGGEDIITFKILKDLSVEKFKGNQEVGVPFEKYQINDEGIIVKL
ncbi:hypothetical protein KHA90_09005 [Flavobacterium psychroterrae]|uniref:DUF4292 domain-containing protein n=1 Tax=Flavobacterium psychroterrae TaxID=2133767 RepID=A0ABS5PA73_9FLAO|nr:hypothetical protein [Flavobacterium psychroterrae]MBS7231163.1 hypothetical protein [Flavobacterium psychroterrae]